MFNLLHLWFRGQTYFSWWWALLVFMLEMIMQAIMLVIGKQLVKTKIGWPK